ncbi:MAG: HTTM domain-containing protein, partial [Proteobacteria bacterium]
LARHRGEEPAGSRVHLRSIAQRHLHRGLPPAVRDVGLVVGVNRLTARLGRPVDGASLAVFRIAFGVLGVVAGARFFTHGWIDKYYSAPRWFFPYWGFSWVKPWPAPWMHVHYACIIAAAACVALGLRTRIASAVLALAFGYAHFCDQTNYLNHYYLYTLLAALGAVVPWSGVASLDARFRPMPKTVPLWAVWLFRFQLGVVYFYGAVGKIGSDWLLHGQPLRIWLAANAELPWLGRFFHAESTALVFSWAGFSFDLCIVAFLSWPRTRRPAYAVLVVFHVLTALLFRIGMFPWMMIALSPVFFAPDWPRRTKSLPRRTEPTRISRAWLAVAVAYVALQLLVPLRSHLYPGNTLWSEEGFRFAWKVMLVEKSGELEIAVTDRNGARTYVDARDRLTPIQLRMVVTQPDMILRFAHRVAAEYDARGLGPVQVRALSEVSFNGRAHAPLVDPARDLSSERDTLAAKDWLLAAPPDR